MRGKGCGSCVRFSGASAEFGDVKWVLGHFVLVINGADSFSIVIVHDIDLGPVVSSLRISTRFVLLHPFPAFFLSVALDFAKIAVFAVSVIVVSASGIAGSSAGSGLVSSLSGVVSGVIISSAWSASLISSGSCPSSVESCDVVGLALGGWLFLPDLVN